MADIPVKISDLDKSYALSASPVEFLINQRDDTGNYQTCTVPLSVVSTLAKEEAKKMLSTSIEVGTIIPYAGKVLGQESIKGWLLCNGQSVKKADYFALWSLIGETYGPSTEENFTLPDFKGRIEMGYSSTGESFEPNFGNWISGEKINLGEGNNPNYPDRGVFNIQLQNTHTGHDHYLAPHTHKILNYTNLGDFTLRYGRWGWPYGWHIAGAFLASPSENWVAFNIGRGEYFPNRFTIFRNVNNLDVIYGTDLDKLGVSRKYYLKDNYNRYKKYLDTPVALIFTPNQNVIDEIKRRKKFPTPEYREEFDSITKQSSDIPPKGGDKFHSNMQSNVSMNFIIKY
jgi:microcystin-dependent protein